MENEDLNYGKCVNSCPYNLIEDISPISSISNSEDSNNCDTDNQAIPENYESPIPYTFRISAPLRTKTARSVTCPPFYLQLDHTIAVLWQLFDPDKKENCTLGVGQLQWALYFLKAIKDPSEGMRSPDIELAIATIEDALLEGYADMACVVMKSPAPQGAPCIICSIEKNIPTSTCGVCTSASWGWLGRPRKSGQKDKDDSNADINYIYTDSTIPPAVQVQTDDQLKNEIEQLRRLAFNLSTVKPGDFKRKKVRVKSFTVLDRTNY